MVVSFLYRLCPYAQLLYSTISNLYCSVERTAMLKISDSDNSSLVELQRLNVAISHFECFCNALQGLINFLINNHTNNNLMDAA